jgi:hypothetical protein
MQCQSLEGLDDDLAFSVRSYGMCHIKTAKLSFDIIAILKTSVPTPASVSIFHPKEGRFLYF